jgi:hypothetical protein
VNRFIKEKKMKIEYSSNNSGGDWWLKDEDWKVLEKAGWVVNWAANQTEGIGKADKDGRWLGALATEATREGLSRRMAIAEWEEITGQFESEEGCPCCGNPHSFTFYDDDGKMQF